MVAYVVLNQCAPFNFSVCFFLFLNALTDYTATPTVLLRDLEN